MSEEFKGRCPTCGQEYLQAKLQEAADEIERLREQRNELQKLAWKLPCPPESKEVG